jgi:hypothetical protein
VPRAPKAPERPKAAQRHPLPHQRLSEETFGYSGVGFSGFQPAVDVLHVRSPFVASGNAIRHVGAIHTRALHSADVLRSIYCRKCAAPALIPGHM